ncbi:hypothetical protein [Luteolibacter sp. AS25]|uniref:hypothetical protein n=1 Tax=Luteolibacter sp. AS25 TaxID=3135776 RepID=UPI00398B05B5
MSDTEKQPKLLAFAGHRKVENKAGLGIVLREEITRMRELLGPRVMAISSAAAGADLVFLRTCVEMRLPVVVIMPFPKERFAEEFEDPAEWKLAENLMSVALAVYVEPGGMDTPEAYQQVSRHKLHWADAFLFAWNGEPASAPGETGETVQEARDMGIPARIVDAGSLITRWDVPADGLRNARHGFPDRKELLEFFDEKFQEA